MRHLLTFIGILLAVWAFIYLAGPSARGSDWKFIAVAVGAVCLFWILIEYFDTKSALARERELVRKLAAQLNDRDKEEGRDVEEEEEEDDDTQDGRPPRFPGAPD